MREGSPSSSSSTCMGCSRGCHLHQEAIKLPKGERKYARDITLNSMELMHKEHKEITWQSWRIERRCVMSTSIITYQSTSFFVLTFVFTLLLNNDSMIFERFFILFFSSSYQSFIYLFILLRIFKCMKWKKRLTN